MSSSNFWKCVVLATGDKGAADFLRKYGEKREETFRERWPVQVMEKILEG